MIGNVPDICFSKVKNRKHPLSNSSLFLTSSFYILIMPTVALNAESCHLLRTTTASSLKSLMRTNTGLQHNFAHIIDPRLASLPPLETFICSITSTMNIKFGVLLTALVYVKRLKSRLPKSAIGTLDTPYRVFLAALLLADKFWSDKPLTTTKTLAKATNGMFGQREIRHMQRAVLNILEFRLYVSDQELLVQAQAYGLQGIDL